LPAAGIDYRGTSPRATTDPDRSPSEDSTGSPHTPRALRSALPAVSTSTPAAPAIFNAFAHSAAVAPVVITSSTSRTWGGGRRDAENASVSADLRSVAPRRACGGRSRERESSSDTGVRVRRDTVLARARAWSYPRSAKRARERGTHVITSGSRSSTAAIAPPSAAATPRSPANLSRWIALRRGPLKTNADLARSTSGGGQSSHRSTAARAGAPQREHSG
jgi:hypothetical protein